MNTDDVAQAQAQAYAERGWKVESELREIWSEVLGIPAGTIDLEANFFSLGGDSLLIAGVAERVASRLFSERPDEAPGVAEFFSHRTVRSLASRIIPALAAIPSGRINSARTHESSVAIVGMACRFPGAPDIEAFWRNLRDGVESICRFSDSELLHGGATAAELHDPNYVKSGVVLEGLRLFDAEYFGLTSREAMLTSPEQRLLLECSVDALQDAGYWDGGTASRVGVFIGTGVSAYLLELLAAESGNLESSQGMALLASNTSPATRISYCLDLVGPSITIDTACSSSLVAVHEACQAILRGECAMALAGGATVRRLAARGYFAESGGIFSPDGHCRPFDQQAQGTVSSSGAGMVLLKRLSDAVADRDSIYAVVRGTAINNDGGAKAAYTAPCAVGQADVIRTALAAAGTDPATIRYLETHGTATPLGDAIELAALQQVFGSIPNGKRPALGALKANLGHMEAAAGIGGLIKTALVLKHRQVPPAIHFTDWASGLGAPPFEFCPRLTKLAASEEPLRAGVSAFGIGGTNAHAVLEEAPRAEPRGCTRRTSLLVISARSKSALREACRRLAIRLKENPPGRLADIAYTLQVGRRHFVHRGYVVATNIADSVHALESAGTGAPSASHSAGHVPVVFVFPDRCANIVGGLQGLYDSEPRFRQSLDECNRLLQPLLGRELLAMLTVPKSELEGGEWCEPILFALEYSLAQVWRSFGIAPSTMIGCGLGEYVAASLSGLFTLEDALKVVAVRGRLMPAISAGRSSPGIDAFTNALQSVEWGERFVPYVSSQSGRAVERNVVARPEYWMEHLRGCVRHRPTEQHLIRVPQGILLELGPGSVHTTFVRAEGESQAIAVVPSLSSEGDEADQHSTLIRALGSLWQCGVTVDWHAFNALHQARRVPLPGYPFERVEHWATEPIGLSVTPPHRGGRLGLSDWFNIAVWEQTPPLQASPAAQASVGSEPGCCVVFGSWRVLESAIEQRLAPAGTQVVCVSIAAGYSRDANKFTIGRGDAPSIKRVFEDLEREGNAVTCVVHCAEATAVADVDERPDEASLEQGLYGLSDLCAVLSTLRGKPARLVLVTRGAHVIADEDVSSPRRGMLAVAMEVVAKEFPDIFTRTIDIATGTAKTGPGQQAAIEALVAEIFSTSADSMIAIRGARRWVRQYRRAPLFGTEGMSSLLRVGGAYLVSGGMGGIGWTLAQFLGQELGAKLILVGRSSFPHRSEWLGLLGERPAGDPICKRILEITALEERGAQVLIMSADVASESDMRRVVALAVSEFGQLNGVIHAAGVAGSSALHRKSRESIAAVLAPKVMGTWAIHEASKAQNLDFFVCCSSIATVIAPAGWYDYCAASAFQDGFCEAHDGRTRTRFLSIDWDRWIEVGMAANLSLPWQPGIECAEEPTAVMSPREGVEVFRRVLWNPGARWIVSTHALNLDRSYAQRGSRPSKSQFPVTLVGASPSRVRESRPPEVIQSELTLIWRELLGIEAVHETDDFFSLGGDSLTAIDLHTRLEAQFGRSPSLRDLLAEPTLGAMAQLLQGTL